MPVYPNKTPFKRAVDGIIETDVVGDMLHINSENLAKSATVVVGKSGAVDYLTTDYASDDVCIRAAVDYVNGLGGGSVLVREGDYYITSSRITVVDVSNVDVIMNAGVNLIMQPSSVITFDCENCSNMKFIGGNFVMNINEANQQAYRFLNVESGSMKNITIEDAIFTDATEAIILSSNPSDSKITDVTIRGCRFYECIRSISIHNYGVVLGEFSDVLIENNLFQYYISDPISGYFTDALRCIQISGLEFTAPVSDIKIKHNVFENYYTTGSLYAILIGLRSAAHNISVDENTFRNLCVVGTNGVYGLAAEDADEIYFRNNHCENIGYSGTENAESHAISIAGDNATEYGKGAIITGNFIKNIYTGATGANKDESEGIYCKSNYTDISGNVLIDAGDSRAIVLKGDYGAKYAKIDGNIIIYVSREPYGGGISSSTDKSIISNNIILMAGAAPAIELLRKINFTYTLSNNYVTNAAEGVGQGIYALTDIPSLYMFGNIFTGTLLNSVDASKYTLLSFRNNFVNGINQAVGNFIAPAVPASTVNYTNAYGYPCQVQVYGGTVTEIDIDDIATGLTAGVFIIPPGGTINITYSAAPSWRWWGL